MRILALLGLLALAACGADGEPVRPTAAVGVSAGDHGIDTDARIGATEGRWSVGLSL